MEIIVRRGNHDYGPYSTALAQKYLAAGQLKPGDLARLKSDPPTTHRTLAYVLSRLTAPTPLTPSSPPRPSSTGGIGSTASSYRSPTQKSPPPKNPWQSTGLVAKAVAALVRRRKPWVITGAVVAGLLLVPLASRWTKPAPVTHEAPQAAAANLAKVFSTSPSLVPVVADAKLLADADAYALALGPLQGTSVPDFAKRLNNPNGHPLAVEPLWKVRCIYRWIAENIAYNAAAIRLAHRYDYDPDAVLQKRIAVCEGYAALFTSLCLTSGIDAVTITGHLHSTPEEIGRVITPTTVGHAWNAAKVGSRWLLVDTTAAAGYVDNNQFVKRFDPSWFDESPERMIQSHLPEDAHWQLLPQPVSQRVFEQFPIVKPRFFFAVLNAGDFSEGTRPGSSPFLQLMVRHDSKVLAHLLTASGSKTVLTTDLQVEVAGISDRVSVYLPAGPTSDSFVEVSFNVPGDTPNLYSVAVIFRVGKVSGAQAPPPAAPSQPAAGAKEPVFFQEYAQRHAKLVTPLEKNLAANRWQHFRIVVPGAHSVQFIQDNSNAFLHRNGPDTFEGDFFLNAGTCGLYAAFGEAPNRLPGLVEFEAK